MQAENAQPFQGRHVGESLLPDAVNLVLGVEPHPQPASDVGIHDPVGFADAPKAELVGPALHLRVQVGHHFRRGAGRITPIGYLGHLVAETLDAFPGRTDSQVRAACSG